MRSRLWYIIPLLFLLLATWGIFNAAQASMAPRIQHHGFVADKFISAGGNPSYHLIVNESGTFSDQNVGVNDYYSHPIGSEFSWSERVLPDFLPFLAAMVGLLGSLISASIIADRISSADKRGA